MKASLALLVVVTLLCVMMTTHCIFGFNLTILHTNDLNARVQEMDKDSKQCTPSDSSKGKCYGGVARLKTKIDELRGKYPNSLLLDGGDQFQGTLFFHVHGGLPLAKFMNKMGYNAMCLGNHEFDKGPEGMKSFLDESKFDVLSSNINIDAVPSLAKVKKSVVVKVAGRNIGIVGYTTTMTTLISSPGKVTFVDEIEAVREEVNKLTGQGVDKIIALGHTGYAKDKEIAKNVPGIDIVIGGHTNTFLYTGKNPPAQETPQGPYPTIVKNTVNENVLVIQDYAYGKYLGFLQVNFDDRGVITAWNGNPILMDKSVPKDEKMSADVRSYLPAIEDMKKQKVGQSLVYLHGDKENCFVRECNMGNLLTDVMVHQNLRYSHSKNWNHVSIALLAGSSIHTSISKGDIKAFDILTLFPYGNTIDLVDLPGDVLWDVLEHSASSWSDTGDLYAGFLQMSGIRVVYDMKRQIGKRVVDARVLCADCEIPQFGPLNLKKTYKVLIPSRMVAGDDGYSMIQENIGEFHTIGKVDSDLLFDYVRDNSPIFSGLDGRIQFVDDLKGSAMCGAASEAPILRTETHIVLAMAKHFIIFLFWLHIS